MRLFYYNVDFRRGENLPSFRFSGSSFGKADHHSAYGRSPFRHRRIVSLPIIYVIRNYRSLFSPVLEVRTN